MQSEAHPSNSSTGTRPMKHSTAVRYLWLLIVFLSGVALGYLLFVQRPDYHQLKQLDAKIGGNIYGSIGRIGDRFIDKSFSRYDFHTVKEKLSLLNDTLELCDPGSFDGYTGFLHAEETLSAEALTEVITYLEQCEERFASMPEDGPESEEDRAFLEEFGSVMYWSRRSDKFTEIYEYLKKPWRLDLTYYENPVKSEASFEK